MLKRSLRQPDGKLSPAAFSPVSRAAAAAAAAAAAQVQTSAGGAGKSAVAAIPLPQAEPAVVFTLAWPQQLSQGATQSALAQNSELCMLGT